MQFVDTKYSTNAALEVEAQIKYPLNSFNVLLTQKQCQISNM